MLSIQSLIYLTILLLVVYGWYESMRSREFIINMCRKICRECDLQLLDQTVTLGRIGLRRSQGGWLSVHREFHFEVSSNGRDRLKGYVSVLGKSINTVQINYNEGTTYIYPKMPGLIQ